MAIFKINDVDYECEFKLSNPDGQKVEFTKSAIKGMTIIDNVFDPFMSAEISLANPYDFIEQEYAIRGDGRDEFLISFKVEGEQEGFKHTFVIANDSDIVNKNVRSENIKNLTLVSKDSIPFSDKIPYNKSYGGYVGDILKSIFEEVLGEDKVDKEKWESGDFIFSYTPPATFRYIDLIHYLMRIFYAKDGDIHVKGFISLDEKGEKYTLKLLSKIFADNDKDAIEAFGFGDLVSDVGMDNPNNPNGSTPTGEFIGGLRNLGYSTPSYGWVNDFFINALVFAYNPILGRQEMRQIKFDDVKKKWAEKFVDKFKSMGGKPKAFAMQNKTTSEKYMRFKMPYNINDSVRLFESEVHNFLTFHNLQISFNNVGNVTRSAGKFIDIYSPKKNGPKLKSEEKTLGRWYITQINHSFYGEFYTNEIFCTKTYVGPNAKFKEDVD